ASSLKICTTRSRAKTSESFSLGPRPSRPRTSHSQRSGIACSGHLWRVRPHRATCGGSWMSCGH
ncbi:hypothetical protein KEM55_007422, partial [Ascosphaera atra]